MPYAHIDDILAMYEQDSSISDVHLTTKEHIWYRNVWQMFFQIDSEPLTKEDMELYTKQLLEHYVQWWEKLLEQREIDFNYYSGSETPYRVNAFFKLGKLAVAMRKIAYKPIPLENLIYDDVAQSIKDNVLNQKTWMFLVTWPTGSWKTTSMIAMLDRLNEHRQQHIVTIEDPIEYIFERKNCLISQRELGADTTSFAQAMKSAMRQDPDIIFVWEIRDPDTAEAAMNLAETWHLVFSTLHTRSASNTVYRIISLFPPEIQESIKDRLAASLLGVQSQFLLQTADGENRIWLFELMLNNTAIRNDIRKNEWRQIDSIIETSRQRGMISMREYAKRLFSDGRITQESVDWLFG